MTDSFYNDSIFMRNNKPELAEDVKRNHGQFYLYNNVPNANERLEATFRSMGREYEWDLEKYRSAAKGIDKGNKRRFFKNTFRFIKNPVGYSFWAFRNRFASTRLLGATLFMLGASFMYDGFFQSQAKQIKQNYRVRSGVVDKGTGTQRTGPYDDYLMTFPVFLSFMSYSDVRDGSIVVGQANTQGHRLHFDQKRAYGN